MKDRKHSTFQILPHPQKTERNGLGQWCCFSPSVLRKPSTALNQLPSKNDRNRFSWRFVYLTRNVRLQQEDLWKYPNLQGSFMRINKTDKLCRVFPRCYSFKKPWSNAYTEFKILLYTLTFCIRCLQRLSLSTLLVCLVILLLEYPQIISRAFEVWWESIPKNFELLRTLK